MRQPDWQSEDGRHRMYCGDCLDIMASLDDAIVDAFATDPPYCSGARTAAKVVSHGGVSHRGKWTSKPIDSDQMTTVGLVWLLRAMAVEACRLLKPGGSMLAFTDWRQYPNAYGAIETANLRIQALVVWDKETMALGNGFRNQHELIIHASKGVPTVFNRSTPNVVRSKRVQSSDIHPTEKPVDLMEKILPVVSDPGSLVLDPFAGSGTTGMACANMGRRFIGIERDPAHFATAVRRIEKAVRAKSEQLVPCP